MDDAVVWVRPGGEVRFGLAGPQRNEKKGRKQFVKISMFTWLRDRRTAPIRTRAPQVPLSSIPGAFAYWCSNASCWRAVLIPASEHEICPYCGQPVSHVGANMNELQQRRNLDPTTTGEGTKPIRWHQKPTLTTPEIQERAEKNMSAYMSDFRSRE